MQKSVSKPMLLLVNIGQLVTMRSPNSAGPRRASALKELNIIKDAAVLCGAGRIISVGKTKAALRDSWVTRNQKKVVEFDCQGRVVLPGFVDSHTHPAFIFPRLVDFEKRIADATYEEIAESGGGIRSSVEAVRRATRTQLTARIRISLGQMLAHATTTVEAKSGYGLSLDSELKSLEAIRQASSLWPGTVVPTLLAAHTVPAEFKNNSRGYVKLVCKQIIPQVAKRKLAKFVDVFCDTAAFSEEESLQVFAAAKQAGLQLRAHVSQLARTPLTRLLEFDPASVDHLDRVDDADVAELARSNTVATMVPGANYFLGLREYPPARKLIDAGAALALATDYNPGSSPTASMPLVLSLACTQMRMSPEEAISAATINGAWALGLAGHKGSIEAGKDADLAIFGVQDYREIPYWIASDLCAAVVANGRLIPRGSWF